MFIHLLAWFLKILGLCIGYGCMSSKPLLNLSITFVCPLRPAWKTGPGIAYAFAWIFETMHIWTHCYWATRMIILVFYTHVLYTHIYTQPAKVFWQPALLELGYSEAFPVPTQFAQVLLFSASSSRNNPLHRYLVDHENSVIIQRKAIDDPENGEQPDVILLSLLENMSLNDYILLYEMATSDEDPTIGIPRPPLSMFCKKMQAVLSGDLSGRTSKRAIQPDVLDPEIAAMSETFSEEALLCFSNGRTDKGKR